MNSVRKPESQRGPQFARSANAIEPGMRTGPRWAGVGGASAAVSPASAPGSGGAPLRKPRDCSPWLESTREGSRIARIVASTKTRAA